MVVTVKLLHTFGNTRYD